MFVMIILLADAKGEITLEPHESMLFGAAAGGLSAIATHPIGEIYTTPYSCSCSSYDHSCCWCNHNHHHHYLSFLSSSSCCGGCCMVNRHHQVQHAELRWWGLPQLIGLLEEDYGQSWGDGPVQGVVTTIHEGMLGDWYPLHPL